jgi:hypothetical protein
MIDIRVIEDYAVVKHVMWAVADQDQMLAAGRLELPENLGTSCVGCAYKPGLQHAARRGGNLACGNAQQ